MTMRHVLGFCSSNTGQLETWWGLLLGYWRLPLLWNLLFLYRGLPR